MSFLKFPRPAVRVLPFTAFILCLLAANFPAAAAKNSSAQHSGSTGSQQNVHPYLLKSSSEKNILEKSSFNPWSILHQSNQAAERLQILAFRVNFAIDSSELTTGNGHFGIGEVQTPTQGDREEWGYYPEHNGKAYIYDDLPHDKAYFERKLAFAANYFKTVSRGKLDICYRIFPEESGYVNVPEVQYKMTRYSPSEKKPKESWYEYYDRRLKGLLEFVRDAIQKAAAQSSPFAQLRQDPSTGILYMPDTAGIEVKTIILLIHAGASYWTDGGEAGYFGQDTKSDMIDAFISADLFEYYKDTVKLDQLMLAGGDLKHGVIINNTNGAAIIDELMMVSETSNQDSLNWGIHGILVNQIARQLGIPDLHSDQSEVGAFCIMDIAGYSAGRGFIPPWPSAWVRAYMGWDTPVPVDIGSTAANYPLKAVGASKEGDTTILLVPINDHEYYLIENRQRSLQGSDAGFNPRDVFNYDTTFDDIKNDSVEYISPYDPVNFAMNTIPANSKEIDAVRNYDVSIPASGVLVWHVDENLVRNRLAINLLNIDSLYGAIKLVEADGINDMGMMFMDVFYQAAFDYGGAEDVFPHTSVSRPDGKNGTVNSFGPFTRPSTQSNDGSNTYLTIGVQKTGRLPAGAIPEELSAIRDYFVTNVSDSVFTVTIGRDELVPGIDGWPARALPAKFFEPAVCNVYNNGDSLEVAVLDSAGRLYVWQAESMSHESMGDARDSVLLYNLKGDTAVFYTPTDTADTAFIRNSILASVPYLKKIPSPIAMPSTIGNRLFIPSENGYIYVLDSIGSPASSATAKWDSIPMPAALSTYICNYSGLSWAAGCADGSIVFGTGTAIEDTVLPDSLRRYPVQALCAVYPAQNTVAAIHKNGRLALVSKTSAAALSSITVSKGIQPYTLTAADFTLSGNSPDVNIVVCDSRQGLWMFSSSGNALAIQSPWKDYPLDWASAYSYTGEEKNDDRRLLPVNGSSPSIADIDDDGVLDIVTGGSNGIFAFNSNGVLLDGWPSELDNRYWYQRGSIMSTPVIGLKPGTDQPRVVFSSPTGSNVTFSVAKIDSAPAGTGRIYFSHTNGSKDSISGLTQAFIDTLLVFGDSIILPYITPGGYIDAIDANTRRPDTIRTLANTGATRQSYWPLATGGGMTTSPLICDLDRDSLADIIAVSNSGSIMRYELSGKILPSSAIWPQAGFSGSRTFAYQGPAPAQIAAPTSAIQYFYSYPNPAVNSGSALFRYKFSGPAANLKLDIFTYTGYHVFSLSGEKLKSGYPGANEYEIDLKKFGPGVYRCRFEAVVNGSKQVKFWKMAVVK